MTTNFTPVLAELGSLEKNVVTIFAVAGGFFVGAVITHLLIAGACKFIFKKRTPERTVRVVRVIGGVGAAILFYWLLSGEGGFGLGGKGGDDALNKNKGDGKEAARQKQDSNVEPKNNLKIDTSNAEQITVAVLRFDSPEKRFYRYQNDPKPLTLEELLSRIDAKAHGAKKVVVLIQAGDPEYPYQAATLLELKLQDRGIPATLPQEPSDGPKKN